tara:strand:+ start:1508 stop:1807 length:300 start_codon:yes stop_codon:yes gene_type:complete
MSNSFKNIGKKLEEFKKLTKPDEPKRRVEALRYLDILAALARESYKEQSTSDYMFIKTLVDATVETKYFGGFTTRAKDTLRIIEKRYNYIYEEGNINIE